MNVTFPRKDETAPTHRRDVRVVFELSGEHPTLPRAEALAALEAERVSIRSAAFARSTLCVEAVRPPPRSWKRVALSRTVGVSIASGGLDDALAAARRIRNRGRTVRVRAPALEGATRLEAEKALGAALLEQGGRADLVDPDVDFRILGDGTLELVRVVHVIDRAAFERSHRTRRELGQPVSLHPKYARALVNLSRCPTGGRLLDPFSGMGGILAEAIRAGVRPSGGDLVPAMVQRSSEAVQQTGRRVTVRVADVAEWSALPQRFAAIATDPPYGRSATTGRERLDSLYDRAFATFSEVLRPGGYAAVVLPSEGAVRIGEEYLELVECHALRVHRSLTRRFCAFRAAP